MLKFYLTNNNNIIISSVNFDTRIINIISYCTLNITLDYKLRNYTFTYIIILQALLRLCTLCQWFAVTTELSVRKSTANNPRTATIKKQS